MVTLLALPIVYHKACIGFEMVNFMKGNIHNLCMQLLCLIYRENLGQLEHQEILEDLDHLAKTY